MELDACPGREHATSFDASATLTKPFSLNRGNRGQYSLNQLKTPLNAEREDFIDCFMEGRAGVVGGYDSAKIWSG